jgi:hypothetical protein
LPDNCVTGVTVGEAAGGGQGGIATRTPGAEGGSFGAGGMTKSIQPRHIVRCPRLINLAGSFSANTPEKAPS